MSYFLIPVVTGVNNTLVPNGHILGPFAEKSDAHDRAITLIKEAKLGEQFICFDGELIGGQSSERRAPERGPERAPKTIEDIIVGLGTRR